MKPELAKLLDAIVKNEYNPELERAQSKSTFSSVL